jgi:carboxymethylenebutenolidase
VDQGVKDIAATLKAIRADAQCNGKAGAVGYCLGGLLAFLTATRTDADGSVAYYGVGIENRVGEAEKLTRPLLMHVAEKDQFVPKEAQAIILQALAHHPQVELHTYADRDHAFARKGGEHYHEADAKLANERTAAFFKKVLG